MSRPLANAGLWIAHQARVWMWGAKALFLLAVAAAVPLVMGAALYVALDALLGVNGPLTFAGCVLLAAPFGLAQYMPMLASYARRTPPPREIDLIKRQIV